MIKRGNSRTVSRVVRRDIPRNTGVARRGPDQTVIRTPPYSDEIGDIGGTRVSSGPTGRVGGFPGGRTVDDTRDVVDDRRRRTTNNIHAVKGGKSKRNKGKIKKR